MSDTAVGFLLIGIGMVIVLGIVFAIASRPGRASSAAPHPPRGVHLPGPSLLPVVLSVAAALLGAALAFRADGQLANPFLGIAGLLVLIVGAVAWVRSAGTEWRETEHGPHDERAAH